ncbi:hypothetical protein VI817_002337 [Penicillium citrinum]|nr:hypothetical protein VI817_002337 [Penicillium citrinum]
MTRNISPRIDGGDADSMPAAQYHFDARESLNQLHGLPHVGFTEPADDNIVQPPTTSKQRRRASSLKGSLDEDTHLSEKIAKHLDEKEILSEVIGGGNTVFYLAYGSNLSAKTFLGKRGIKPLSQIAVLVPGLRLTFNLPGVPYAEPCFATTQFRDPKSLEEQESGSEYDAVPDIEEEYHSEKAPLVTKTRERRVHASAHCWNKPLIGVVYEVTLADYAKIIATEGGGGSYRDIVVDCHAFPDDYKYTDPVPSHPDTPSFKAHTLLSQGAEGAWRHNAGHTTSAFVSPTEDPRASPSCVNPHMRPNLNYAQPSVRYLNLLITGAAEHNLPLSYQKYLSDFRPYQITTFRQKLGKLTMMISWGPLIIMLLTLCKQFGGPDGRSPPWLVSLLNLSFAAMWNSYDYIFKWVFGDGERTLDNDSDTPCCTP